MRKESKNRGHKISGEPISPCLGDKNFVWKGTHSFSPSRHTPKRIQQAGFVPSQVLFVLTSSCATDGCANSLYFFINKQMCHRWVCQLSLCFSQQAGVPRMCLSTLRFFSLLCQRLCLFESVGFEKKTQFFPPPSHPTPLLPRFLPCSL